MNQYTFNTVYTSLKCLSELSVKDEEMKILYYCNLSLNTFFTQKYVNMPYDCLHFCLDVVSIHAQKE